MKKTGIITHYNVHNHGAVLQLYALHKVLSGLGYDAKALQYKKNYDFMSTGIENKYSISVKSIPFYIKYVFKNGIRRTLFNIKKRKILINFKNDKRLIGEYYSKADNLELVVIGSDEIFSIESGLNPCFWGMGVKADKIISYAASCGPTVVQDIIDRNAVNFIKAGIETIDTVLVRDKNTQTVVKTLGGKDAAIVCDPVLLYDFREELVNEIVAFKAKHRKKYCIVYSYDYNMNDAETVTSIKKYAKDKGLKIVSVGYYHKWCDKNVNADPLDVFLWFSGAEAVFTDTFHGTVISMAARVDFFTKVNGNANKLGFLLEQYQFNDRKVESFTEIFGDDNGIDYAMKEPVISAIRESSLRSLKAAIGDKAQ